MDTLIFTPDLLLLDTLWSVFLSAPSSLFFFLPLLHSAVFSPPTLSLRIHRYGLSLSVQSNIFATARQNYKNIEIKYTIIFQSHFNNMYEYIMSFTFIHFVL